VHQNTSFSHTNKSEKFLGKGLSFAQPSLQTHLLVGRGHPPFHFSLHPVCVLTVSIDRRKCSKMRGHTMMGEEHELTT